MRKSRAGPMDLPPEEACGEIREKALNLFDTLRRETEGMYRVLGNQTSERHLKMRSFRILTTLNTADHILRTRIGELRRLRDEIISIREGLRVAGNRRESDPHGVSDCHENTLRGTSNHYESGLRGASKSGEPEHAGGKEEREDQLAQPICVAGRSGQLHW